MTNDCGRTAVTSVAKAELFSENLLKNSTMDNSVDIPPTHSPPDFTMFNSESGKGTTKLSPVGPQF